MFYFFHGCTYKIVDLTKPCWYLVSHLINYKTSWINLQLLHEYGGFNVCRKMLSSPLFFHSVTFWKSTYIVIFCMHILDYSAKVFFFNFIFLEVMLFLSFLKTLIRAFWIKILNISLARWLSCWNVVPYTKRWQIRSPFRAHTWDVGSVPSWGMYSGQLIDVSHSHRCFSFSFSPPLSPSPFLYL